MRHKNTSTDLLGQQTSSCVRQRGHSQRICPSRSGMRGSRFVFASWLFFFRIPCCCAGCSPSPETETPTSLDSPRHEHASLLRCMDFSTAVALGVFHIIVILLSPASLRSGEASSERFLSFMSLSEKRLAPSPDVPGRPCTWRS